MIKYHFSDNRGASLEVYGDLYALAAQMLYMISLIHGRMERVDPALGKSYQELVLAGVLSPESPVFAGDIPDGNAQDICMILPKKRDDGKEQSHE